MSATRIREGIANKLKRYYDADDSRVSALEPDFDTFLSNENHILTQDYCQEFQGTMTHLHAIGTSKIIS